MFDCPTCSANLRFDPRTQDLACSYCGNHYAVDAFDEAKGSAEESQEMEVTIFTCPQCGGELVSTDNEAAVFCSYCGASNILESRLGMKKRPRHIIPFKLTKDDCKERFIAHVKKTGLAPKALTDPDVIESFRGIYMPYWVYSVEQRGTITLKGEESRRSGDYIVHKHYSISGSIDASYEGYSKDSASTFDDDISEAIAPYDLREAEAFSPAYMSGFYADTSDVDRSVYEKDAVDFALEESVKKLMEVNNVGSKLEKDSITADTLNTKINAVDSAMCPVWFMSYRSGDRISYAAVNGQTGKVMADVPISKKKYFLSSLLIAIPIFIVLNLFVTITPKVLLIISIIAAALTFLMALEADGTAENRENRTEDRGWLSRNQKPEQEKTEDVKLAAALGRWNIAMIAAALFGIALLIISPASDLWYYGAILFELISVLGNIFDMIRKYNLISSRPLPQFSRTGGDDRA